MKRILLELISFPPRTLASDGFVCTEPGPQSEIDHRLAFEQAVAGRRRTIGLATAEIFEKVTRAFGVVNTIPAQQNFDRVSILVSTSPDALRWLFKIELTLGNVDRSVKLAQEAAITRLLGRRFWRRWYE